VIGASTLEELLQERGNGASGVETQRAWMLLELQRNAMAMFTSCGWFFSDISGIETLQILRYAARAAELAEEMQQPLPIDDLLATLDQAQSNNPAVGTGADIFRTLRRA
jgi:hypothetical protein